MTEEKRCAFVHDSRQLLRKYDVELLQVVKYSNDCVGYDCDGMGMFQFTRISTSDREDNDCEAFEM